MKTKGLKTILAAVVVLITVSTADADNNQFVSMLKNKHHNQILTLISQVLTGQDKTLQLETIKEIVRLELAMATLVKTADHFYINRINLPDLDQIPGRILHLYLSDKGHPMQTAGFFEGKTFTCYR